MTPVPDRPRQQIQIIASMYIGYGAMMICRQMLTILSPAIVNDPELSFTNTQMQDILGYGTIGALAGKLIWGLLGDRLGGRVIFLLGIALSALMLIAFGASPGIGSFIGFSFLLYGTKSAGWPGMTKLVDAWYHPRNHGRVWSILSTSSRASVVLASLCFPWLLNFMHWRWVMVTAAVTALLIFAICHFSVKDAPADPEFLEGDKGSDDKRAAESAKSLADRRNHPLNGLTLSHALLAFAGSGRCWLVAIMVLLLTVLMAFLDFLPTYLEQVHHLSEANAGQVSSAFPFGSFMGLIASIFFYDRFSKKGLRRVLSGMLAVATGCVMVIKFLPETGLNPQVSFLITLVAVFMFAFMIAPSYYVPMSTFSIEFGGPFAAALVCLIDACGFAASAILNFRGGRLVDKMGWDSFMTVILVVAGATTAAVWAFTNAEYRAFHRDSQV